MTLLIKEARITTAFSDRSTIFALTSILHTSNSCSFLRFPILTYIIENDMPIQLFPTLRLYTRARKSWCWCLSRKIRIRNAISVTGIYRLYLYSELAIIDVITRAPGLRALNKRLPISVGDNFVMCFSWCLWANTRANGRFTCLEAYQELRMVCASAIVVYFYGL